MPDIELRFNKDLLVLSAPLDATLARQGIDVTRDRNYLNLMEPEVIGDALRMEASAGAQCIVTTTEDITRARLAHVRMDSDAERIAHCALRIANATQPQHVLVEIGPCGLPLDPSSKASLNENRSQYADAARAFSGGTFDAFFLNGFTSINDLRCALMGVAQTSDKPMFASVVLDESGRYPESASEHHRDSSEDRPADELFSHLPFAGYSYADENRRSLKVQRSKTCLASDRWPEAVDVMVDLGAAVVGFETAEPIAKALEYASQTAKRTSLPLLTELHVTQSSVNQLGKLVPPEERDDYAPDTITTAAAKLYGAGVQFLRATGLATPAYTGALAATVMGLDVRGR